MGADRATVPAIFDTTTAGFAADVLERSETATVAVNSWAPWCAPCRTLAPILEELVRQYAGRLLLARVNTDEEPALAAQFAIRSIPDVRIFRDGRMVDGFVGVQPIARLEAAVRQARATGVGGRTRTGTRLAAQWRPAGCHRDGNKLIETDPQNHAARIDRTMPSHVPGQWMTLRACSTHCAECCIGQRGRCGAGANPFHAPRRQG